MFFFIIVFLLTVSLILYLYLYFVFIFFIFFLLPLTITLTLILTLTITLTLTLLFTLWSGNASPINTPCEVDQRIYFTISRDTGLGYLIKPRLRQSRNHIVTHAKTTHALAVVCTCSTCTTPPQSQKRKSGGGSCERAVAVI